MKPVRVATVLVALAIAGGSIATALAIVGPHGTSKAPAGNGVKGGPQGHLRAPTLVIAGRAGAGLYPGAKPVPIDLVLKNPRRYAITLRSATVTVKAVRAPRATRALRCTVKDFLAGRYSGRAVTVPPGSTTLKRAGIPPKRWPTVAMIDRPANQNGCMGATVELAYRGLALKSTGKRR